MVRTDGRRGRRGFTLVELLVTMAIGLILMAAVYQFFIGQQRTYSTQDEVARAQQQARMAETLVAKAVQLAGSYVPGAGTTVSMRGQSILAATDRYLTLQYDDPLNTADPNYVSAQEVVTFAVSKIAPMVGGGTDTINTTVWFDKNGNGTIDDPADSHNLSIGLDLSGPPYTLYRITPTAAGGIDAEAIASNVDNLIFRYYDRNGAPVTRDAATGAEVLAVAPLTQEERAAVRAVDLELVLRTRTPDAAYNEPFPRAPDSVATYDAGGVRNAVTADFNDNFRRRVFRSRITPRSLAIASCGRLDLSASPATPACPNGTTVTATVLDQYRQPVNGATVTFGAGDGAPTATTANTNASGVASFNHLYTGTSKPVSVWAQVDVQCTTASGTDTVTLHNSTTVNYLPGPPHVVNITGPSIAEINTCENPDSFTFDAAVLDQCGNSVPPAPGLFFEALLTNGAGAGTVDGNPAAELTAPNQTFTVRSPAAGPYGAPDAAGDFRLQVQQTAASTWAPPGGIGGLPVVATVHPWPPSRLEWLPANLLLTHTDCPSADQTDTFRVLECKDNAVYSLTPGFPVTASGFSLQASVTPAGAVVSPADHGTLFSAAAGVSAAALQTSLSMTNTIGGGLFDIGYRPPTCTLGPPPGHTVAPTLGLDLVGAAPTPDVTQPLTLQACADCSVAFQAGVTPCTQSVPVTISGCQFQPGTTVQLEVTYSGAGKASFAPNFSPVSTMYTHTFAAGVNSFTTNLYIENQAGGDTFTVTAYYPTKAAARWNCAGTATVQTSCARLKVYSKDTYLPADELRAGAGTCLSKVKELFFDVSDCQVTRTLLDDAVEVWTEANGVKFDQEWVDLVAAPTGTDPARFELKKFNLPSPSTGGLPLLASNSHTSGDGALTYPLGVDVRLVVQYTDPAAGIADRCTTDVDFVRPVPVCFPNAITSGGGGTWNGNFDIHWGDVVIMGNVELPSQFVQKFPGASFTGNKVDRFFDIYVGEDAVGNTATGNFLRNGADVCGSATAPYRPFVPGQPNFNVANPGGWIFGNYFCNVSYDKISQMIRRIDYVTLKSLAKQRGVYWYTLANGNVHNPNPGAHVTQPLPGGATPTGVPLETVLDLRASNGGPNGYHNGQFIFVDTFLTANIDSWTGNDIDAMCAPLVAQGLKVNPCETPVSLPLDQKLPLHSFSGGIYTSGIVYIAGTLGWGGSGGGMDLNGTTLPRAVTPPQRELHYLDNASTATQPAATWTPTNNDLPIRPDPALAQSSVALSNVHLNGAMYLDGALDGGGNITVFGAVTAERGFKGSGVPTIWYNYDLNVSGENLSLCVSCCGISVNRATATLFPGNTIDIDDVNADGAVYWWSGNPAVATVDQNGLVRAVGFGSATISVRDQSNCVASTSVVVADPCTVFRNATNILPGTNLSIPVAGSTAFSVNFAPSGSVNWTSSDPTRATITAAGLAQGVCPGATTITAVDPSGQCAQGPQAVLQVTSGACALQVNPVSASIAAGSPAVLTASGNQCGVTWTSSNPSVATVSPAAGNSTTVTAGAQTGVVTVTAADAAGCLATATIGVGCPVIDIRQAPAGSPLVPNTTYTLTASGGVEPYTWALVSGGGTLTPGAAPVTAQATYLPVAAGTVEVRATDANGCARTLTLQVACPASTVAQTLPAINSVWGRNSASGSLMPWQAVPNDGLGPNPSLAQIERVEFRVQPDPMGVGTRQEFTSEYCGFGTDACGANPGNVSLWPSGTYQLEATAVTRATHPCGVQSVAAAPVQIRVCNVTVRNAAGAELGATYSLNRSSSEQMSVIRNNGAVTWTSNDPNVFTVTPAGLVATKNVPQTTTATLTATDAMGCSAQVAITVVK